MRAHVTRSSSWLLPWLFVLHGCNISGDGSDSAPVLGINAELANLILSVVGFDQPFDPDRTSYTAMVNFQVTAITMTATTADRTATLTVNGDVEISGIATAAIDLSVGENVLTVVVTAENGTANRTYTITLTRQGNVRLANLTLSAGNFDQIFQPGLTDYTATVSLLRSTTRIIATPENSNTTVTVNGAGVIVGENSRKITLDQGSNSITIVVTAEDGVTTATYTIEVTRETPASFSQRAYIKAPSPQGAPQNPPPVGFPGIGDRFGSSIAMDRNILAVGAWGENSTELDAGATYIFVRDEVGIWSQQTRLTLGPEAEAGNEHFGINVALDGERLFVAAIGGIQFSPLPIGTGNLTDFGQDAAGNWGKKNTIRPGRSLPDALGGFGGSIGADEDLLVVGAPRGNNRDTGDPFSLDDRTGDAFVFVRDGNGGWIQEMQFLGPSPDTDDSIGSAVAVDGDTVAIAVPGDDSQPIGLTGDPFDNSVEDSGAVFVLRRAGTGTWVQEAFLKAPNGEAFDLFGSSVALSGDTLVVSAPGEDGGAKGVNGDRFDNSAEGSGAAYVFTRDSSDVWTEQAYIKASNADSGDGLTRVALLEDTLIVSAAGEDSGATGVNGDKFDNSAENSGAVYLFTRDAIDGWTEQAYIKASNTDPGDGFARIALTENTIVVGAANEASLSGGIDGDQSDNSAIEEAGAVYVFQ